MQSENSLDFLDALGGETTNNLNTPTELPEALTGVELTADGVNAVVQEAALDEIVEIQE